MKSCGARPFPEGANRHGEQRGAVERAARWHDIGKAHPVSPNTLKSCTAVANVVGALAKSPCSERHERPRFRHEAAAALPWLEALLRIADWRASAHEQRRGDQGDRLGVTRQSDAA